MSIKRRFNSFLVQNSQSEQYRFNLPAARQKQDTVLQQNTKINPNPPGRERIIFQVEDDDETLILQTTPNKDRSSLRDVRQEQDTVLQQNIKANPNTPRGERIVQVEEETAVSRNIEHNEDRRDLSSIKQGIVRSKNVASQNAIVPKAEPNKHYCNLPAVQNSGIVKYNRSLPTVHEDEFLPPIGRWTKFGGLFIVAVVLLAIPISAMTKYKETIKTQATVRPDGELRLVQAATEGRVTQVAVRNNQAVKQGETIATIDDSRLQTQKSQLEDSVQKLRSQLVQMNAQMNALDNQISAEKDRIQSSVAAAESELDRVRREYQDKQVITQAEVQKSESDLEAATSALNAARAKLNRYQNVAKEGAISQDQLQEVQQASLQQQQTVKAAQAKLTSTQAILNPSNAEVMSATSKIAEAKAIGAASLATLNKERQALIQRRIELSQQIDRDTQELRQTKADLQQTTITATSNGIISQLNLRNPGQILRPGEQIAQIAPTNSQMVIKAAVPAKSVGKLELGQTAQMRVSACPYSDYGTLKGTVAAIAPDAVAPQADNTNTSATNTITNGRGASFYEVVIEPNETILGKENNQCVVQLGMEGQADIVTKEETVLQFLLRKARLTTNL